jgi:LmbE family N-acetylglucosaminyl deacetylase
MRIVRFKEQKKAAVVGEYAAQVLLDFPSRIIKDASKPEPVTDIATLLKAARPKYVYTHNLADKHDTHVAVACRIIAAIRSLPAAERPQKLYAAKSGATWIGWWKRTKSPSI